MILERPEAARPPVMETNTVELSTVPWVISGKTPEAVRAQAAKLLSSIEQRPELRLVDAGMSLVTDRSTFEHRAVVLAADRADAARALSAIAANEADAAAATGCVGTGRHAVLFSGQGSQRLGMGRELYERFPVFAEALDVVVDHLDAVLPAEAGLREVMWGDDAELLNETG
ncbi:hypothetical protein, partial [Streptomyces noursei]|uniref:CurL C-terminal domain-containing protein n=1 Tax=Streptomyces noursei TaxID=1971 RepID=UPI001E4AB550